MASQEGIFPLKGTIGNVTFVKTSDGRFLAQRKTSMTKQRLMNDTAFVRTRENNSEFGRAGKASLVLRTASKIVLQLVKDKTMNRRLVREMMKVIKADLTSVRGQRNVVDGEAELLQGFDFNSNASLTKTLWKPYTATINRVAGTMQVVIPSIIPYTDIVAPEGTTHFKLVSAASEVDFENGTFITDSTDSGLLTWDLNATAAITLATTVTVNSSHPLFLLFGIQFYQNVNGNDLPLFNGAYNAVNIVKVEGV